MQHGMLPSVKLQDKTTTQHNWTYNFSTGLSYLNLHQFATIVRIQGVSISTCRNSMSLIFVPGILLVKWWRSKTPLTVMWLIWNLMTRHRFFIMLSKIENDVINEPAWRRTHTLKSFKVWSCLHLKTKKLF